MADEKKFWQGSDQGCSEILVVFLVNLVGVMAAVGSMVAGVWGLLTQNEKVLRLAPLLGLIVLGFMGLKAVRFEERLDKILEALKRAEERIKS